MITNIQKNLIPGLATSIRITPITITAKHRNQPQVSINQGKGFIYNNNVYTARHVIQDVDFSYHSDNGISLTQTFLTGNDVGIAYFSGSSTGHTIKIPLLSSGMTLVGLYRNNIRTRNTGQILEVRSGSIITNIEVLPGDSGSPVVLPYQKLGIISQSHNGTMAIIEQVPIQ